ncbi:Pimeloyl-ACP methyl ester carboxylesterase [Bosea sp. OK403]|uniref:alpha/beta fold hydrolase n=1 Tax=Bosea sp. OK403 TaxID=1855286 RepID=UPI0008E7A4BB|nr:alpha/beta hydrolase [Bosea sp. OK403]SFI84105.1 Pimeloyl-ACP methyl ester carboxylesterase [Bosea sp. OK403]
MPYVEANRVTIAYESFGPVDGEVILLIAGLGTQMLRWSSEFCDRLMAQGFRVIRFDNRDAGLSTHLRDHPAPDFAALSAAAASGRPFAVPYTLEDMASDTLGLLDALGIEQAHLVGRSMGGMIAQIVASAYPHRTLSLAAIMSATGNPELPKAAPEVMAMLMRPAPAPSEDLEGYLGHNLAFARRIAGPGYPFDEMAQRALIMSELARSYDPAGTGRQIAAIAATGDLRPRLSQITAPTLAVHGADDSLVPTAAGADIAASISGARLMIIDGMGHDLPAPLYNRVVRAIAENARSAGQASNAPPRRSPAMDPSETWV